MSKCSILGEDWDIEGGWHLKEKSGAFYVYFGGERGREHKLEFQAEEIACEYFLEIHDQMTRKPALEKPEREMEIKSFSQVLGEGATEKEILLKYPTTQFKVRPITYIEPWLTIENPPDLFFVIDGQVTIMPQNTGTDMVVQAHQCVFPWGWRYHLSHQTHYIKRERDYKKMDRVTLIEIWKVN